jgi:hypothetical protein
MQQLQGAALKNKMKDIKKLDKEAEERLSGMMHFCADYSHIKPREIVFPLSHLDNHRTEMFRDKIEEETHYVLEQVYGLKWDETKKCFTGLTNEDYQLIKNRVTEYALKSIITI